ncbi:MAG: hypothetical protein AAB815_03160 [Patescibacteria group bacterium]
MQTDSSQFKDVAAISQATGIPYDVVLWVIVGGWFLLFVVPLFVVMFSDISRVGKREREK